MTYSLDSRSYLKRAKSNLEQGKKENLFYAAFELRCGIEARMQQYLDVQDHISQKKKKGWKIVKLAKNIEEAFKTGDNIVAVSLNNLKSNIPAVVYYYTPVRSKLRKYGQRLGKYLHTPQKDIRFNKSWWEAFRKILDETYNELEFSNKGTLLGTPMQDKRKRINFKTEGIKSVPNRGEQMKIEIKLLKELPKKL